MSAHLQDADAKAAKLTLRLKADSGYTADAEYQISANQWSRILMVAEDGKKGRVLATAPELLMALRLALPALEYLRKQFPRSEHDDSIDVLAVSKAAIAKATGEPQ